MKTYADFYRASFFQIVVCIFALWTAFDDKSRGGEPGLIKNEPILLATVIDSATICPITPKASASKSKTLPGKTPTKFLPNVVQVHRDVYSGGLPLGENAFEELRALGIQTIISVDGITPDVVSAKVRQMRYVHLPHSYDGVPPSRVLEIAKTIRDLPKPIYIHCHHGLHRSPAAASAGCVAAGLIRSEDSLSILKLAGTDKNYVGLYASVQAVVFEPTRDWNQVRSDFPSISPLPPIAEAMVSIDQTFQNVQSSLADSDNDSACKLSSISHDLLMLRELYSELLRDRKAIEDSDFSKHLNNGLKILDSIILVDTPIHSQAIETSAQNHMTSMLKLLKQNCVTCHQVFRNVPQQLVQPSSD